jgi:hypothetical protein
MNQTYTFQRGEPIAIGDRIESVDGMPGGALPVGTTMRARMKPAPRDGSVRMPGDDVAAVVPGFNSIMVAAMVFPDGVTGPAFVHSMTAAQSLQLPAGRYLFDSSTLINGLVIDTSEPDVVIIRNSASAPA